jgi:hypothetical protein
MRSAIESTSCQPRLLERASVWEVQCDLRTRSLGMGAPTPWMIFAIHLRRKDSMSLATLRVSNEMGGMQALKVAEAARD